MMPLAFFHIATINTVISSRCHRQYLLRIFSLLPRHYAITLMAILASCRFVTLSLPSRYHYMPDALAYDAPCHFYAFIIVTPLRILLTLIALRHYAPCRCCRFIAADYGLRWWLWYFAIHYAAISPYTCHAIIYATFDAISMMPLGCWCHFHLSLIFRLDTPLRYAIITDVSHWFSPSAISDVSAMPHLLASLPMITSWWLRHFLPLITYHAATIFHGFIRHHFSLERYIILSRHISMLTPLFSHISLLCRCWCRWCRHYRVIYMMPLMPDISPRYVMPMPDCLLHVDMLAMPALRFLLPAPCRHFHADFSSPLSCRYASAAPVLITAWYW